MSPLLIIRASACSSVPQFLNSFQKDNNKMISLLASALVLSLVWYNHLLLDHSGETMPLCSGLLFFGIQLIHGQLDANRV